MALPLVLAATLFTNLSGRADTIFDNSVNDLETRFNPGTLEVGDEIILDGTARYLTNFTFEFWGTNTADPANLSFAGNVQARVRFYLNNGPLYHGYATPGTNFYDSGWFTVPYPTPRSRFVFVAGSDFPAQGLFLPASDLTWTVQFKGMAATDSVGVDLFSPPVVGNDYNDYWQLDLSGWSLRTFGTLGSTDFAARLEATTVASPTLQLTLSPPNVVLSWPAWAGNYVLETSANLGSSASWSPLTSDIVTNNLNLYLTNSATAPAAFYRLHRPQ